MANSGTNISSGLIAKFMLVIAGVSILANLVLIFAFINFFPLHKIQGFFVKTETMQDKSLVIQKFDIDQNKKLGLAIMTSLVRQYVLERERFSTDYRYTIDAWGEESNLKFMSSRKIYMDFMHSTTYKKVFTLGNPSRKSRFVKLKEGIKGINYHPHLKEWEVNGKVIDYQEGASSKQVQDLKIILKVEFAEHAQRREYKDRFKNPFGFIVKEYKYQRHPSY